MIHRETADRLEEELIKLVGMFERVNAGRKVIEPPDGQLLRAADALRRILEAIYQYRMTFRGEYRPPTGPLGPEQIDVEEVAAHASQVIRGNVRATKGRLQQGVKSSASISSELVNPIHGRSPMLGEPLVVPRQYDS